MQLKVHTYELPLRHVFTISRESISVQPTLIVELEHAGLRGFGEATTNRYYGATIPQMAEALDRVRDRLASWSLDDPARLWDELAPEFQSQPFAQCGARPGSPRYLGKNARPTGLRSLGTPHRSYPRHKLHPRNRLDRLDDRQDERVSRLAGLQGQAGYGSGSGNCSHCTRTPTPFFASTPIADGPRIRRSPTRENCNRWAWSLSSNPCLPISGRRCNASGGNRYYRSLPTKVASKSRTWIVAPVFSTASTSSSSSVAASRPLAE